MVSTFLVCRYLVFALLTVYNAIISSIAAWNLGYSRGILAINQVDQYLIVIGMVGTLFIFPVICIDISRKGAHTSRVYFEVAWVSIFWILHLCGAAATTAITPIVLCRAGTTLPLTACTSAQVLVAFTWISMMTHLSYLLTLVLMAIFHSKKSPGVWRSGVRDFPWFSSGGKLRRLDSSSDIVSFQVKQRKEPARAYGRPRAMTQTDDYTLPRPYQYLPSAPLPAPGPIAVPAPIVNPFQHPYQAAQPMLSRPEPSLYPQYLGLYLGPPRQDQDLPPIPPAEVPPPQRQPTHRYRSMSLNGELSRPRPSGPRPARHRPPPLDLSKLSNLG